MTTARAFSHERIEAFLKARDLNFFRDGDGDFVLFFRRDKRPIFRAWLIAEEDHIYVIRVESEVTVLNQTEKRRWYERCNQWNAETRWPKAYLIDSVDDGGTNTNTIAAEEQIDLSAGIDGPLFEAFTDAVLAAGLASLYWLLDPKADSVHPASVGRPSSIRGKPATGQEILKGRRRAAKSG